MKLCSTSDLKQQFIDALVYGDSGCGKTTSLKTLPADRTFIAIGERGALPLLHTDYKYVRFTTWEDVRTLIKWFMPGASIEDPELAKVIPTRKILCIDSLSEVSQACMRHIVEVDRRHLVSERTKAKRDTPENIYADLMTMEDYKLYNARMYNFLNALVHLPVHVICTCRSAWSKDKDGGTVLRTPNLSGKMALECAAFFDLVLYMQVRRGDATRRSVWQTFHDEDIVAKDASGSLDPFEETDWTKLFKKILGTAKGNK